MFCTKIGHTSGSILNFFKKNVKNYFKTMLPYRVQCNESESDIQHFKFFTKSQQKRNTLDILKILPSKTDTHKRFRTRNRILEPVRIFYKKYVVFDFYYKYIFIFTLYIYIYIIYIYFLYIYIYTPFFCYIYI